MNYIPCDIWWNALILTSEWKTSYLQNGVSDSLTKAEPNSQSLRPQIVQITNHNSKQNMLNNSNKT